MRGLYWVRSDLRIFDNWTLRKFCEECSEGILLWCPSLSQQRGGHFRKSFIQNCTFWFSEALTVFGQKLVTDQRPISRALPDYLGQLKIDKVYFSLDHSVEETWEEQSVQKICRDHSLPYEFFDQSTLISPSDLPFTLESMPLVFTQFRKKIEERMSVKTPLNTPSRWPTKLDCRLGNYPDPVSEGNLVFTGGEQAALKRVQHYLWDTKAILTYKETRNGMLHWDDSMKLSAWLSMGCLSARFIYDEVKRFEKTFVANESTYWTIFELLWRDYFKFLSRRSGNKIFLKSGLGPRQTLLPKTNPALFEDWCQGRTDVPFINANMRELNETGWMSNRGRQNVASFLIHQLQIPWTWGAKYFEKALIDYDPDQNWGNWLYLSGNGTDPRSRVFNALKQANDYDPYGEYVDKWLKS